jgi:hypothetical protein
LTSAVITSKVSEHLLYCSICPNAPDGPIVHGRAMPRGLIKMAPTLVSDVLSLSAEERWLIMI